MFKNLLEITKEKQIPIWFMRQAGRYMNEYLQIRSKFPNFMDMCLNSEAATEITLQPIKKFDFDAAIIFSDILTIPHFLGFDVKFDNGPILKKIKSENDLDKFQIEKITEKFFPIRNAILNVKKELSMFHSKKSLIGFSGAPWTIFCYMIDERIDKNFINSRKLIYEKPEFFTKIIEKLTEIVYEYLILQIESGVDTVKIFDSWAGALSYKEFELFCLQPLQKITQKLKKNYPHISVICFPKGVGFSAYKKFAYQVDCDILATDVHLSIEDLQILQKKKCIQSNLDPMLLSFDINSALQQTKNILHSLKKSFIFNLGHGIRKETPVENVQKVIDLVRELN